MIQKRGDKFVVTDKSGTKVLGTHPSKEKAAKQLAAIEISKAKHMQHENKRFKDFRNTLTESEYKETLTGYPNRGINTEDGPVNFGTERVAQINAMLNAISRSTFQTAGEAFIKIRTRLNLLMLDFPWTPYMWQGGNTGPVVLTVTLFGRVDGVDGISGNIGPTNGKANPTAGLKEFTLVANIEIAEDGLYRVTAKLGPKTEPVMAEEGVEVDGDALDEMAQTPARQRDMEHKIQRHEAQAQKGYEAKMNKTGKAAARGRKLEDKHDAASRRVIKQDTKEYESEKLYGRGGKVVKSKSKPVKEGVEAIEEMHKVGDTVKVPHKGKMVKGKIVRHDNGGSSKAQQHGGGYVVDVGEYSSITVPHHKIVKEGVEQIDETSKARRLGQTVGAILRGKPTPSDRLKKSGTRHFDTWWSKPENRKKFVRTVNTPAAAQAIKDVKHEYQVEQAEQIDEMAQTKERAAEMQKNLGKMQKDLEKDQKKVQKVYDKYTEKHYGTPTGAREKANFNRTVTAHSRKFYDPIDKLQKQNQKEREDKTSLYGKGGKVVAKREVETKTVRGKWKPVKEELVGGQKKLDVNKNKKLDSHDFKLLRAKKSVKEYTEMMPGIPLMQPDPTMSQADQTGKGKRFHKKALKSSMEEAAKKPAKKQDAHVGAKSVIDRQQSIKRTLDQHGMRW